MYCRLYNTCSLTFVVITLFGVLGWGRWGGLGVEEKRKRQRQPDSEKEDEEDDETEKRKDSHLKYVIINHKRDKKAAKHMVQCTYYCM